MQDFGVAADWPRPMRRTIDDVAAAFRSGALTPTDLILEHQRAIERRNPEIKALVHQDSAAALSAAQQSTARWRAQSPRSRLDGIPVVLKANVAVAGLPWTAGLNCFSGRIAARDSTVAARLTAAGAVILAIANMDEGALGVVAKSPIYGQCKNPIDTRNSPGGSSGGSAAAVAAGFCMAAIGTDTMGSVRIPAALCGVVGFKGSFGRISCDGVEPLCKSLDHIGVLANAVVDAQHVFDCLAACAAAEPAPLSRLRIGVACGQILNTVAPAILDGLAAVVDALRPIVKTIDTVDLDTLALADTRKAAFMLCERDLAVALAHRPRAGLSSELGSMLDFGAKLSPERVASARAALERTRVTASLLFSRFDVLVLPTTQQTALQLGAEAPTGLADFTAFANAAGLPAMAVTIGRDEAGLPLSIQIMTRVGGEAEAFALGQVLNRIFA